MKLQSGLSCFSIRLASSKGSTVLFVAGLVIPLFFLLFSLSLDASRYMTETQQTQKIVDEAASFSYRYLPFQEEARRAAQNYLSRYEGMLTSTEIKTDGDAISLKYSAASMLSFPRFFGIEIPVPVTAYARVRGAPFDTLIMLDTSAYLGPPLSSGSAWGESGEWPASSFFEYDYPISQDGMPLDPRVVTQQCFNPAFSALKNAATTAAEYLSNLTENAVGIGVYPGAGTWTSTLRPVLTSSMRPIGPGESDFDFYSGTLNRNELCAAAAEHELNATQYRFPLANSMLPSSGAGGNPPVNITLPDPAQASWQLNSEFLPYVEARHSLWAEARREGSIGDTAEVLRDIRAQLIGSAYVASRGGLASRPVRTAFIFAGDVPHAAGSRFPDLGSSTAIIEQLSLLRNDVASSAEGTSFKLVYVLFRHPGNNSADLDQRVNALATLFAEQQLIEGASSPRLEFQLIFTPTPEALLQSALGPALYTRRTAILSR